MEVHDFIKKFCDKNILDGEIVQLGNSFFLADKNLMEIKNRIKIAPSAVGAFLGEVSDKHFTPSAILLDMISENSDKKLVVNRKTEWLFLCGRDIFGKGIIKANASKQGELVLVQNERDENLGYGKIVADLSEKDKVVVKRYFDKGSFLRREKNL